MPTYFASAKRHIITITVVAIALFSLILPSGAAHAAATASCTTSSGEPGVKISISVGGVDCIPTRSAGLQSNPIFIYFVGVLKVISGLAGLTTVGGFIWGGFLYISARAEAGQVEKAKMVMINSVIGLFMFIFMYAILQFIVPGGLFL